MAHLRSTAATLIAALRQAYTRRRALALRAAAAVAAPLVIGLIAGYPAAGAQASFGGLAALYVPDAPFRYRARVVGAVGAGLVAAVFLGSLAGSLGGVAAAVTAAAVTGIASFACQATELPPPRELMLVMAVLAATEMPGDLAQAATHAALTAAGAALAWIISMSAAIGHHNPDAAPSRRRWRRWPPIWTPSPVPARRPPGTRPSRRYAVPSRRLSRAATDRRMPRPLRPWRPSGCWRRPCIRESLDIRPIHGACWPCVR